MYRSYLHESKFREILCEAIFQIERELENRTHFLVSCMRRRGHCRQPAEPLQEKKNNSTTRIREVGFRGRKNFFRSVADMLLNWCIETESPCFMRWYSHIACCNKVKEGWQRRRAGGLAGGNPRKSWGSGRVAAQVWTAPPELMLRALSQAG